MSGKNDSQLSRKVSVLNSVFANRRSSLSCVDWCYFWRPGRLKKALNRPEKNRSCGASLPAASSRRVNWSCRHSYTPSPSPACPAGTTHTKTETLNPIAWTPLRGGQGGSPKFESAVGADLNKKTSFSMV